jgi:hypothetical protein
MLEREGVEYINRLLLTKMPQSKKKQQRRALTTN